jgi:hypothetical protein
MRSRRPRRWPALARDRGPVGGAVVWYESNVYRGIIALRAANPTVGPPNRRCPGRPRRNQRLTWSPEGFCPVRCGSRLTRDPGAAWSRPLNPRCFGAVEASEDGTLGTTACCRKPYQPDPGLRVSAEPAQGLRWDERQRPTQQALADREAALSWAPRIDLPSTSSLERRGRAERGPAAPPVLR